MIGIVLLRGYLYRTIIQYHKVGERKTIELTNKDLIKEVENRIKNKKLNLEEIAAASQEITKEHLRFTFQNTSQNPNIIYNTGKANCMGYSSLCNSIANYIITKQQEKSKYVAKNIYGKLELFGVDLNGLFKSKFYETHDYNQFLDLETKRCILTDPSVGDYLKIDRVSSSGCSQ